MGNWANYAIVQDGQTHLYSSKWGSVNLPTDMFFGHDLLVSVIENSQPTENLRDEVMCEGATIVDRDSRRLLFFFSDTRFTARLRTVYLSLLGSNWPGWEIHWAEQGIVDIALALGIDPALVRDERSFKWQFEPTDLAENPDYVLSILTVKSSDRIIDYGFEEMFTTLLARGPMLLNLLQGWVKVTLREDEYLEGGAYLDPLNREMWVWWIGEEDDRAVARIGDFWPGWTVSRHTGGLPRHVELSGRDASFLDVAPELALRKVLTLVLEDQTSDISKALDRLLQDRNETEVQAGPVFFRADRFRFDVDVMETMLARSVDAFLRVHGLR